MRTEYTLIPFALTAILFAVPALSAGPHGPGTGPGTGPGQAILSPLDAQEVSTLTFMREEERLARDVYIGMDDLWQLLPFENIAQSEQKHMDAIKNAMDNYGLEDPSDPNQTGVYTDESLQQFYLDLMERGDSSYLEALHAGALIEEVDIQDLEDAILATDNQDLQNIYSNLLRGSRNHLRIFVSTIESQGVVYEAQSMDQDAVDAIVDTPMERGGKWR
ncbi:Protein of unknown function DUF2202 [Thiorhodococcus drewsii AZ1]|uniref:DUF2202 domain-containing protein n=1 Tax=Thiorhodococcus drewsii AZ1 TaxID=765913 RepID=G2E287_9GAMM|nr:DUF2202 domain-containing protein [Thiorhodococcus drewsii]EGV31036.1 Protein of unknown function DUF2202 [Thiorhodococcus drewsii AZ1]